MRDMVIIMPYIAPLFRNLVYKENLGAHSNKLRPFLQHKRRLFTRPKLSSPPSAHEQKHPFNLNAASNMTKFGALRNMSGTDASVSKSTDRPVCKHCGRPSDFAGRLTCNRLMKTVKGRPPVTCRQDYMWRRTSYYGPDGKSRFASAIDRAARQERRTAEVERRALLEKKLYEVYEARKRRDGADEFQYRLFVQLLKRFLGSA